jgi:hypothetical protein
MYTTKTFLKEPIMHKDIALRDCVAHAKKYPTTFEIPTVAEVASLKVGDTVKLHFVHRNYWMERMWVEIQEIIDGKFKGKLLNIPQLILSDKLQHNEEIEFQGHNISMR